jgi:hypothetical protein
MPIIPVKDPNEYKRVKEALKERFEAEKSGEQDLFREQTKMFQPLIATQQESAKAIRDKILSGQQSTSNVLVPLVKELQRRNDQVDLLAEQPFYQYAIGDAPRTEDEFIKADLNAGLNETDTENLQDMSLDLPSEVFTKKTIEETLGKIKVENRSIGQKLGKGQQTLPKEKEIYESRKKTLEVYKDLINGLKAAKPFIGSTPKKSGKGLKNKITDVIYYPSVNDLCSKLASLVTAKQAGNTGLDNAINSILDELLRVEAICKDEYDDLYNRIFA